MTPRPIQGVLPLLDDHTPADLLDLRGMTPDPHEHLLYALAREDFNVPCTNDPESWYPNKGESDTVRLALALCRTCPVEPECLASALANDERYGVWGGKTARQRRRLRTRQTRAS